jgi:hypothetical protein
MWVRPGSSFWVEQGFSPALKQEKRAKMIADLYAGLKACATPHVVKF